MVPHHVIYASTGAGKTTLIKQIMDLSKMSRTLILDPKPNDDPSWHGPDGDKTRYGRPVLEIAPQFGFIGDGGGGPEGMWFRLIGTPDDEDTAKRFRAALKIVKAEGHCILVLDDVKQTCKQLKLAAEVESIMNISRSANVLVIMAMTETTYVPGRGQAGMTWVGATNGLNAAKAGAELLGKSGRNWIEATEAIEPHTWIYSDGWPGNDGPVLVRGEE